MLVWVYHRCGSMYRHDQKPVERECPVTPSWGGAGSAVGVPLSSGF